MVRRIGCLHAHYSNIDYIEKAFADEEAEWLHFVDPGLVRAISSDETFGSEDAGRKVREQLEWIARSRPDAILITCTSYIAALGDWDSSPGLSVPPIVKIDEPFFEETCAYDGDQLLVFTNPATVEGTLARLRQFARERGLEEPRVEARVLEGLFGLLLSGRKDEHLNGLTERLRELAAEAGGKRIAVAQLSMVDAAERAGAREGVAIAHPLTALKTHLSARFFGNGGVSSV